jgi:AcrR family transcriptional regulator
VPASSTESKRDKRVRPSRSGILDAAERVFAERGYADTPLRDLIGACGCSTTAFYARFESKQDVLAALLQRLIDDLTESAADALPQAKSLEHGDRLGIGVLERKLRGKRGLWRIALTEGAHTPHTRPLIRSAYATLAGLLAAQLQLAGLADEDAEPRAWALVGSISMQLTRWAVFEELTQARLSDALGSAAEILLPRKA